jgi:hypothetical protein
MQTFDSSRANYNFTSQTSTWSHPGISHAHIDRADHFSPATKPGASDVLRNSTAANNRGPPIHRKIDAVDPKFALNKTHRILNAPLIINAQAILVLAWPYARL